MTIKEEEWSGYYDIYRRRALERGITSVEILDIEWWDGQHTAKHCVWPYIEPESVVLEIAAGIGRVSRFVAPRCKRLVCTDILEDALGEARKNLANFDNVEFQKTNGFDLAGFDNSSFDCVYFFKENRWFTTLREEPQQMALRHERDVGNCLRLL